MLGKTVSQHHILVFIMY